MKYKFKDYMFTNPLYSPYYSKYKGHHFLILSAPYAGHVEVQCYSDPTIEVGGYVHFTDLEKVSNGD